MTSRGLLTFAYVSMLATFATGGSWLLSLLVAAVLIRKTGSPIDRLHCLLILRACVMLMIGCGIAFALLVTGFRCFSEQPLILAYLVAASAGTAGSAALWFLYRTCHGFAALWHSSFSL